MRRLVYATLLPLALLATEPDLLSVGLGTFDVDPVQSQLSTWLGVAPDEPKNHRATAALIEVRPAAALVARDGADGWAVRGLGGGVVTDDAALYLHAGGWLDGAWGPAVLGISFGPGLWFSGRGKDLGYPIEF